MKVFIKAILTIIVGALFIACENSLNINNAKSADQASTNSSPNSKPTPKPEKKSNANEVDNARDVAPKDSPKPTANSGKTTSVKIYLVRLNDGDGWDDKDAIGCGDLLVPVTRNIEPTAAPLRAAINELLSPLEGLDTKKLKLENFWKGSDLKIKSLLLKDGIATLNITGNLAVAGICDGPRIVSQISMTATEFPTVNKINVFINGTPLEDFVAHGS